MKYVIDCTPVELEQIRRTMHCSALWESGTDNRLKSVLADARPLSEMCEEEAKRHEVADYGSSNSPMLQEWGRADKEIAAALRSFGSKQ
jgi:hypothetical protein